MGYEACRMILLLAFASTLANQSVTPGAPAPSAAASAAAPPAGTSGASSPDVRLVRLEDAIALALKRQPQVLQAQALTALAWARAAEARSTLLPQVVATGQVGYGNQVVSGGVVPSAAMMTPAAGTMVTPTTTTGTVGPSPSFGVSVGVSATQ